MCRNHTLSPLSNLPVVIMFDVHDACPVGYKIEYDEDDDKGCHVYEGEIRRLLLESLQPLPVKRT